MSRLCRGFLIQKKRPRLHKRRAFDNSAAKNHLYGRSQPLTALFHDIAEYRGDYSFRTNAFSPFAAKRPHSAAETEALALFAIQ